jgi:hypothetical protein
VDWAKWNKAMSPVIEKRKGIISKDYDHLAVERLVSMTEAEEHDFLQHLANFVHGTSKNRSSTP